MTTARRRIGVAITVAALAVLVGLCVFLIALSISSDRQEPISGPPSVASSSPAATSTTPDPDRPVYRLQDRPRYDEMIEVVEGTNERYRAASQDGAIHELPDTDVESDYVQDFLYRLADQKTALIWAPTESHVAGELDAFIAERIKRTQRLEENFLAGEPLAP